MVEDPRPDRGDLDLQRLVRMDIFPDLAGEVGGQLRPRDLAGRPFGQGRQDMDVSRHLEWRQAVAQELDQR